MAQSVIEICNSALVKIGASTIISLDDGNKEANLCRIRYVPIRDEVLRSHPWNCAIKRVILAPSTTAPAFCFSYQNPLPSDCLRVLAVGPEGIEYKIEGRTILCNVDTVYLKYVSTMDNDPVTMDALLSECIALRLAADMAYALTQSLNNADMLLKWYEKELKRAKSVDAKEDGPTQLTADVWIDSRLGDQTGVGGDFTSSDA